jgi:glycosyltransferase involved in cell wall biosynthesis
MNNTKNICLFNSSKTWGGGEKWYQEIGIKLSENKYQFIVCANKSSELYDRLKKMSIKVLPVLVCNLSFINPLKIISLYRIFKKYQIDIIILGLSQDLKSAGLAAKLAGVRQIIYRRGLDKPIKNTFINRFYFKNVISKVIANSEAVKRSLLVRNDSLMRVSDIHVIFNGINTTNGSFRKGTNQPGSSIIIGNAGRLIEEKGQNYLIELAASLKQHQIDFIIRIAGIGKMRLHLESYAKRLKVENSIDFLEFQCDTGSFYEEIDIFVFPSKSEGCSNALLEAMAHGKPVVAFNISSMPEMVDDGVTGFLVPFDDMQSLVEKTALLIKSKTLRKEMGEQACKKISAKFDFNKNLKLLEELF